MGIKQEHHNEEWVEVKLRLGKTLQARLRQITYAERRSMNSVFCELIRLGLRRWEEIQYSDYGEEE